MKLMNVSHIAILPFTTCNFACPYCCASTYNPNTLKLWREHEGDIIDFLNTLDTKMIMVSGGEPLLYDWTNMIKNTNHYWYFMTNGSRIPSFLKDKKVKLIVAAFHRTQIDIDEFTSSLQRMRENTPVFCKIMYVRDPRQFDEIETITKTGIPASFTPLLNAYYSNGELMEVLPYCQSVMYAKRFLNEKREPAPCIAGTSESFEISGTSIVRCSHYNSPRLKYVPQIFKRPWHDERGNIHNAVFDKVPKICRRSICECEWHSFSDLNNSKENEVWQKFIDTERWTSTTLTIPTTTKGLSALLTLGELQ